MSLTGITNGNICIYQGDDFACMLSILNCSDGTPADLTNFTAQSQIRTGYADQTPGRVAAQMTCTIIVPNQISLWIPHEQTAMLRELYYLWDLQLTSSAGQITTILSGTCTVMQQVTRGEWRGHLWDAIVASQPLWRPVTLYRSPGGLLPPGSPN